MHRPGVTHERLAALLVAGILAFTPPLLSIFNVPAMIAGVPALYLYLFGAWATLIALIALVVAHADGEEPPAAGTSHEQDHSPE